MKKQNLDFVRNYVKKLSDDDFEFLYGRLNQRFGDDIAESINFMSKTPEMDRWFATSKAASDLYDMVDIVYDVMKQDVLVSK